MAKGNSTPLPLQHYSRKIRKLLNQEQFLVVHVFDVTQ